MSKFNFTAYMLDIAIKSKDVAHVESDQENKRFFRSSSVTNLEEIIEQLPRFKGYAIVVEDNCEGSYSSNNTVTFLDRQICSFFLLRKAELLNAEDRGDELRASESVMRKIIARMRRDWMNDNNLKSDIGLRNVDFGTISYFSFGPVLDNCYGVHCSFVNPTLQDTKFNPDDWTDG
jgi:hypothetical protein